MFRKAILFLAYAILLILTLIGGTAAWIIALKFIHEWLHEIPT